MDTPSTADRLGWRGNRDRMRIEGLAPFEEHSDGQPARSSPFSEEILPSVNTKLGTASSIYSRRIRWSQLTISSITFSLVLTNLDLSFNGAYHSSSNSNTKTNRICRSRRKRLSVHF